MTYCCHHFFAIMNYGYMDLFRTELSQIEGMCVQCMHVGPYDDEPSAIAAMTEYADIMGYEADFSAGRYHHEIYLSDARRCKPERLKTVIRHPIKSR